MLTDAEHNLLNAFKTRFLFIFMYLFKTLLTLLLEMLDAFCMKFL